MVRNTPTFRSAKPRERIPVPATVEPLPASRGSNACGRQIRAALAGAMLLPSVSGCYTVKPITGADLAVGGQLVLELTDRGRAELANLLGPGVEQIQGRLTAQTDSAYTLRVYRVEYLSGQHQIWTGETVSLNRDQVGRLGERRISSSRSWLAAGVVTAGAAAFVGLVSLVANGLDGGPKKRPPVVKPS
jgi:hypothetical protein